MTEALFYHLTESTLEEALPGVLERSVERGWRVVVQAGSPERRDALDIHLWTYRDASFLAHGTEHDAHPADQPILLTASPEARHNDPAIRFMVDGASPPEDLAAYTRIVFMFDGHDVEQVAAARDQWKAMKAAGHEATYWQQSGDKRWERKA